jgi:hypothetical protein
MGEEVTTTLDAEEIIQKQVNSNGQIYLGRDLAGKTVKVAYEIVDDEE